MSEYQEMARQCKCCTKHVPLPTVMKTYNGLIVCPTTLQNIIEYNRLWETFGSRPMGSIRKHFSEYVQQIVENQYSNKESVNGNT